MCFLQRLVYQHCRWFQHPPSPPDSAPHIPLQLPWFLCVIDMPSSYDSHLLPLPLIRGYPPFSARKQPSSSDTSCDSSWPALHQLSNHQLSNHRLSNHNCLTTNCLTTVLVSRFSAWLSASHLRARRFIKGHLLSYCCFTADIFGFLHCC